MKYVKKDHSMHVVQGCLVWHVLDLVLLNVVLTTILLGPTRVTLMQYR